MKTIRTEEAVGLPLSHDITQIDYGKTKEVCWLVPEQMNDKEQKL